MPPRKTAAAQGSPADKPDFGHEDVERRLNIWLNTSGTGRSGGAGLNQHLVRVHRILEALGVISATLKKHPNTSILAFTWAFSLLRPMLLYIDEAPLNILPANAPLRDYVRRLFEVEGEMESVHTFIAHEPLPSEGIPALPEDRRYTGPYAWWWIFDAGHRITHESMKLAADRVRKRVQRTPTAPPEEEDAEEDAGPKGSGGGGGKKAKKAPSGGRKGRARRRVETPPDEGEDEDAEADDEEVKVDESGEVADEAGDMPMNVDDEFDPFAAFDNTSPAPDAVPDWEIQIPESILTLSKPPPEFNGYPINLGHPDGVSVDWNVTKAQLDIARNARMARTEIPAHILWAFPAINGLQNPALRFVHKCDACKENNDPCHCEGSDTCTQCRIAKRTCSGGTTPDVGDSASEHFPDFRHRQELLSHLPPVTYAQHLRPNGLLRGMEYLAHDADGNPKFVRAIGEGNDGQAASDRGAPESGDVRPQPKVPVAPPKARAIPEATSKPLPRPRAVQRTGPSSAQDHSSGGGPPHAPHRTLSQAPPAWLVEATQSTASSTAPEQAAPPPSPGGRITRSRKQLLETEASTTATGGKATKRRNGGSEEPTPTAIGAPPAKRQRSAQSDVGTSAAANTRSRTNAAAQSGAAASTSPAPRKTQPYVSLPSYKKVPAPIAPGPGQDVAPESGADSAPTPFDDFEPFDGAGIDDAPTGQDLAAGPSDPATRRRPPTPEAPIVVDDTSSEEDAPEAEAPGKGKAKAAPPRRIKKAPRVPLPANSGFRIFDRTDNDVPQPRREPRDDDPFSGYLLRRDIEDIQRSAHAARESQISMAESMSSKIDRSNEQLRELQQAVVDMRNDFRAFSGGFPLRGAEDRLLSNTALAGQYLGAPASRTSGPLPAFASLSLESTNADRGGRAGHTSAQAGVPPVASVPMPSPGTGTANEAQSAPTIATSPELLQAARATGTANDNLEQLLQEQRAQFEELIKQRDEEQRREREELQQSVAKAERAAADAYKMMAELQASTRRRREQRAQQVQEPREQGVKMVELSETTGGEVTQHGKTPVAPVGRAEGVQRVGSVVDASGQGNLPATPSSERLEAPRSQLPLHSEQRGNPVQVPVPPVQPVAASPTTPASMSIPPPSLSTQAAQAHAHPATQERAQSMTPAVTGLSADAPGSRPLAASSSQSETAAAGTPTVPVQVTVREPSPIAPEYDGPPSGTQNVVDDDDPMAGFIQTAGRG